MRIAVAICHALVKLMPSEGMEADDWLVAIKDPGVHIKQVSDIQASVKAVHKKCSRELIKDLFK